MYMYNTWNQSQIHPVNSNPTHMSDASLYIFCSKASGDIQRRGLLSAGRSSTMYSLPSKVQANPKSDILMRSSPARSRLRQARSLWTTPQEAMYSCRTAAHSHIRTELVIHITLYQRTSNYVIYIKLCADCCVQLLIMKGCWVESQHGESNGWDSPCCDSAHHPFMMLHRCKYVQLSIYIIYSVSLTYHSSCNLHCKPQQLAWLQINGAWVVQSQRTFLSNTGHSQLHIGVDVSKTHLLKVCQWRLSFCFHLFRWSREVNNITYYSIVHVYILLLWP